MSVLLGPIHYMMYNKITKLNNHISDIISWSKENSIIADLDKETDKVCLNVDKGVLEDIIDLSNIHSWLSHQVKIVEERYAFVVKSILDKDNKYIDDLYKLTYEYGQDAYIDYSNLIIAEQLFQAVCENLLDGMPCDKGITIQQEDDSDIIWEIDINTHKPYWDKFNADFSVFLELRSKWLEGFFSFSYIKYMRMDKCTYRIMEC